MLKDIPENFCGVLALAGGNEFDSHFSVAGSTVTIIPISEEARKKIRVLSYTDGTNNKENWIYGVSDANSSVEGVSIAT